MQKNQLTKEQEEFINFFLENNDLTDHQKNILTNVIKFEFEQGKSIDEIIILIQYSLFLNDFENDKRISAVQKKYLVPIILKEIEKGSSLKEIKEFVNNCIGDLIFLTETASDEDLDIPGRDYPDYYFER